MRDDHDQWQHVNVAFTKQSDHFDAEDLANPILQRWRKKIYNHTDLFLKPNSRMLELNAGTGIDALRFAQCGHSVHATDLSDGMIKKIKEKIDKNSLNKNISVQQVSFEKLNTVNGKFDFVFSNFGGLNCTNDLEKVVVHLPQLLNEGAFVTWVIMPKVSPWEWSWVLKGKLKEAFRRFNSKGVKANLEGEIFTTYYYSLGEIKKSFGPKFKLIRCEGLGVISPPPSAINFVKKSPRLTNFLNHMDEGIRKRFPFNRWGDHLIVTFQLK
ncbi:MAG: class I SAM-dependent methyltransferase [Cyclobacteriaceae bacterium]